MTTIASSHSSYAPLTVAFGIGAWALAVVIASLSGVLRALGHAFMPGYAILVALGIGLPVAAYFASASVRGVVDGIGVHRLTLMHMWRVPAALLFFYYGARGALPAPFWILAGAGDFLSGSLAATALFRERSAALYRRLHIFGFVDFVIAVATGLTFTLLGDPRMATLTMLPMALIPLFGVGLSGASHIIALRSLDGSVVDS
jgi:hypothetical protein